MWKGNTSIFGLVLCLLIVIEHVTAHSEYLDETFEPICYTPTNLTGTCLNINKCKPLLELLEQKPLLIASSAFLRKSHCGFEGSMPKVCCRLDRPSNDLEPPNISRHPNLRLLDHEICGPINKDKIMGGKRAGLLEFPWMALLGYRTISRTVEFQCGGSIINKRYILTAAHCVTNLEKNTSLLGVRVGEYDISNERDCIIMENFQEYCAELYRDFSIENVIIHPHYSPTTLHNDIAIIRVDRDIDFRFENTKPICLPIGSAAKIPMNKLIVTGWGLYENQSPSPKLLKVTLPRVSQEECAMTYARKLKIWHKQMCMGGKQGDDACKGDSGGPLQAPTMNYSGSPRYVQYGIVSFGMRNCGTEGFPSIYTRLDFYMDWLLDNLRE